MSGQKIYKPPALIHFIFSCLLRSYKKSVPLPAPESPRQIVIIGTMGKFCLACLALVVLFLESPGFLSLKDT
ncbi:MAG: hypothetical protein QNK27_00745 [Desulfuromusa sp.]|nr:hypothetical protein [Desulfuromusa sp.]